MAKHVCMVVKTRDLFQRVPSPAACYLSDYLRHVAVPVRDACPSLCQRADRVYDGRMAVPELSEVLDYILNRSSQAEFEVIVKACERRRADLGRFAGLGGINPGALAGRMAESLNQGVADSMDRIRDTVRQFVEDLIRENAPEATDRDVAALVDHYLPDRSAGEEDQGTPDSGLPPEALAKMAEEFVDYSLGRMVPSAQKELWDSLPSWQERYWESFPPALRAFIKARLEGRMGDDEFWTAALSLLGL